MTRWLIETLGLQDRIPEGAQARFEWGNLPRGESGLALVLAVAFAVALTVWLYRREGSASSMRKGALACCRLLVFVILLGVVGAWAVTRVLNWTGLSRLFWHPPLAMLGLMALLSALIGLYVLAP